MLLDRGLAIGAVASVGRTVTQTIDVQPPLARPLDFDENDLCAAKTPVGHKDVVDRFERATVERANDVALTKPELREHARGARDFDPPAPRSAAIRTQERAR